MYSIIILFFRKSVLVFYNKILEWLFTDLLNFFSYYKIAESIKNMSRFLILGIWQPWCRVENLFSYYSLKNCLFGSRNLKSNWVEWKFIWQSHHKLNLKNKFDFNEAYLYIIFKFIKKDSIHHHMQVIHIQFSNVDLLNPLKLSSLIDDTYYIRKK